MDLRERFTVTAIALVAWCASAHAQMPDPPGQVADGQKPLNEAYLFAHMTKQDYGRLYYSVSLDGLHWTQLNGGRRVLDRQYYGHPDICRGPDGRFYLVGNPRGDRPPIQVWVSDDLITWSRHNDYSPNLKAVPGYPTARENIGAPKLFFDDASGQFLLTWHTPHDMGATTLPEPYWASQRTLYVTSKDLKTFTDPPRRLFEWNDVATIDTILRKVGDTYYAIVKDERYPTLDWTTGKTIRVTKSKNPTGPWEPLSPPISPNFREAPALIPSPDGKAWYCYYEQYPGTAYDLSVATSLDGPWFQAFGNSTEKGWNKFETPAELRHGGMLVLTRKEYDALVKAFPTGEPETQPGR